MDTDTHVKSLELKSNKSHAVILPQRGGLISSLCLTSENGQSSEILWLPKNFEAASSSWPGGGLPFLFPFAGRVWHKGELYKYALQDDVYAMPLHGFSWATAWMVVSGESDRATLRLESNDTSRGLYPFNFRLTMAIQLSERALSVRVTVENLGSLRRHHPKMPVAIGWHPYLTLATSGNSVRIPAERTITVTAQGGAGKPSPTNDYLGAPPWNLPKPEIHSLIFSGLKPEPAHLQRASLPGVAVSAGPDNLMRHIVTWSNEPTEFFCIEPWMSLPDAVASPSGCQWLDEGASLEAWLKIEATRPG